MPVSLCEWRVRIGTFVHWIRDYEIREKEERLLKERTRRVKVLCERLRAKHGVSEQESGDGSETSDKSEQGDCNSQDPTDAKVGSRCLHGTATKLSSGNTQKKDLLTCTSCDHCIKDLLTPNDSHVKDILAPSDASIKELLTQTDSCIEDLLLPSDVCQNDPHTASDSCPEDLTTDDCHIHELLNKSDSCIRGLLTASDSWEDVPLLLVESYGNEGHTPLEPCNKDLLPAPDSFDTWSELQAQSCSYVNNPVTPKDSFIHELLMPRDPNIHNFLKDKDSHISKILTPKDSYVHDLLMSEDSYTIELLKPANFSIKELFISDSSGVKVPFCIDVTITDLPTSTEYCIKEHQITSDSSISEQVTPSNASKEHINLPDICTEEQNTLLEVVIEGQPLAESAISSLSMLHDSCHVELLDNDVRMQGNLDHLCRKEQPTGKSPLLAKSDDCTCALNLPNTPSPTPTSLNSFAQCGLPNEKETSNASSRSPCQSMASLNGIVDAVLPPHPCLNDLLLIKAGDVELNPGPLHGSIDNILHESELVQLAEEVPPEYFLELCNGLGFRRAESQKVLTKHLLNIQEALIEFLWRWKVKQRDGSNCRAVLAEILGKANMVVLQTKLLSGGYLPSKTSASAPGQDTSQPLTREQVDRCGEDLRTFYRTQRCKIKTDPLDFTSILELERIYTNLTLLRNKMGAGTTIPLHYTELFTTKMDGELPKRFLVEGEGGVGKTTLCSKIAWDWANGSPQFRQFSWVLAIPVREIMKGQTVGDIVKNYLSDSNTVTPYQIDNYILSQPSKVLIVLDGLDEYDGNLFAEEHSDLSQILRLNKYKGCIVLVTTRPWKAVQFKNDEVLSRSYAFLTLQGFSPSNVSAYIKKYFVDDDEAGSDLISFIESNDVIRENMAPFPIYIAMLCLLWRDADSMKRATVHRLKTFSQLLDQMILFLKNHYVSKITKLFGAADLEEEMERTTMALLQIGSVAFSGLLERKLAFREEDFISCKEAMEICHRIGVLSQKKLNIGRWKRSRNLVCTSVYFPHKLFQEYIAALYLASLYETDRMKYKRLLDRVTAEPEEFRYLLYFAAAQGKDIGLDIIENKIQQTGEPSQFLVDVTFEACDQYVAKSVGQRIFSDKKPVTVDGGMSAHTVAGYLFIMQQLETETLIVRDRSCGQTVSHDLGETLSSSSSLSRLEFCRTTLDEDFYQLMSRQGLQKSSVRELHIDDKFLDDLQRFNVTIEDLFPGLDQLHFTTSQPVSLGIIKHLAHPSLAVLSIGQCDLDDQQYLDDGEVYRVPITGDPASVGQLFSGLFPHLTSLTFSKLVIGNIRSEAILHGLRDHLHLKSIGIIRCFTDDKLDPLARKISAEKGMAINLEHDADCLPQIRMGNFRFSGASQEDLNSFLHSLTDYESDRAFSSAAEHVDTLADEKGKISTDLESGIVGVSTVQVKRESKLSTVEGIFNDLGGELHLDTYGFKLIIPPGALQKGTREKICFGVLTDLPHDLILGDDEMIVSFGFSCHPSGLHFKKPVSLIIPHCAILKDPGKVEVVLYVWSRFTNGIVERIPQCPETCVVKQNHFELLLQHFSQRVIVIKYERMFVDGKSMLCMPFLQKKMPASRTPVLNFRLRNKLPSQALKMDEQTSITQAMTDHEDDVFVRRRDLTVSCRVADDDPKTKIIEKQNLFKTESYIVYFKLNLFGKPDETLVTLDLSQITHLREIMFNTRFTVLDSAPSSEWEGVNSVTQEQLDQIARKFPHNQYTIFCNKLGTEFDAAQAILEEHNQNFYRALMKILMAWKARTGGPYTQLETALRTSGAGNLVALIKPEQYSTLNQHTAQEQRDHSSRPWPDQPHHSRQYSSGAYFTHWPQSFQGSESWQPDISTVQQSARSHHQLVQVGASFADRPGISEHPHITPYPHPMTYSASLPLHQPVMPTGNHPQHQSLATDGGSSNWSTSGTAYQVFPPTTFSSPIQNRTYRPSDSHGYNTLGTSNPFLSTFDEGRRRPNRRRAPATQSRPPEDISEIPEKKPHL